MIFVAEASAGRRIDMEIYAETAMSILYKKNKRLQGAIYNYDVFGKLGAPKEISYFEAAKVLREAAEAALDAMGGENNA